MSKLAPGAEVYLKRTPAARLEVPIYRTESTRRIAASWRNIYAAHRRIFHVLTKRMALGGVEAAVIAQFVTRYQSQLSAYQDAVETGITEVAERVRARYPSTCASYTPPAEVKHLTFLIDNPASTRAADLLQKSDRVSALLVHLRAQSAIDHKVYWKTTFEIREVWATLVRNTMALGDTAARDASALIGAVEALASPA